jgi:hypothetical protein
VWVLFAVTPKKRSCLPVGESGDVLLIIDTANEDEIHTTLEHDPWSLSGMRDAPKIQRWTILLESGVKA